ncbi:MAG: substrate-binding domain-containing protein [Sphingobacteriales bacterium]|nr:substrate-binding domain-containing protein [Sphingobacteriales bacterium]
MGILTKFLGKRIDLYLLLSVFLLTIGACTTKRTNVRNIPTDTDSKGTIKISVDETFKPVIDEQVKVFENTYPQAHIIVEYKPEAACFRDLDSAGTRMIIVTREPNSAENVYYQDKLQFKLSYGILARDAIAIVVNRNSPDSVFSRENLKAILDGSSEKSYKVVFDGLKATSTVRFAIDSILKGKKFDTSRVKAVENSRDVLNYVAANTDAIGLVGVSWIGNPEDLEQQRMLEKVNIALIKCENCLKEESDYYLKPTQRYILSGQYPLTRGLYYIAKESYPGLGRGFAEFMWQDKGQLIFKRAYLAPAHLPFIIRKTKINK